MISRVVSLAACTIALLLAGCGGSSHKTSPPPPTPPASTNGQWAWIGGMTETAVGKGVNGVYGTKGTASAANMPGSRGASAGWSDSSGNLWVFGGFGFASSGDYGELNDLWEFNPSTAQWTWINGSNMSNVPGTYGTLKVPSTANTPGARQVAASWTDNSGNFWIFGGGGYTPMGTGTLDDLWMYAPKANTWTWMSGSTTPFVPGTYGSLGVPSNDNTPGSRQGSGAWTDAAGNLWLFGGYGIDGDAAGVYQNDLWKYDTISHEWTWVGGSKVGGQSGNYGTLGVGSATNYPGARFDGMSWTDASGHFWLFGGFEIDTSGSTGRLSDLWEFDPASLQWTWVSGSNLVNLPGNYGTQGTAAASNIPGARTNAAAWNDSSSNLWMLGGSGYAAAGPLGDLNDLWKFDITTRQWTWMNGTDEANAPGVYGTMGTPATANYPGGRAAPLGITDKSGNFWLFGGYGFSGGMVDSVALDDLWRYHP